MLYKLKSWVTVPLVPNFYPLPRNNISSVFGRHVLSNDPARRCYYKYLWVTGNWILQGCPTWRYGHSIIGYPATAVKSTIHSNLAMQCSKIHIHSILWWSSASLCCWLLLMNLNEPCLTGPSASPSQLNLLGLSVCTEGVINLKYNTCAQTLVLHRERWKTFWDII